MRFVLLGIGIILLAGGREWGDERETALGQLLWLSGAVFVCVAVLGGGAG